jgi:hypothetical protein
MNEKLLKTKKFLFLLIAAAAISLQIQAADISSGLKLHYSFEQATDNVLPDVSGNGYNGTLFGATVGVTNGKPSLILGTSGGDYVDMGANTGNLIGSLNDFTISTYIWVNSTNTNLNANGNFICVFANSANTGTDQNGIIFFQAKRSRYAISATFWNAEQFAQTGQDVVKGQWVHLTYTQAGTTGRLYVNGELRNTNTNITLKPADIGATAFNYIAKPTYSGDINLQNAQLSDFRIYNRAITQDEILILNGYPADLIEAYNALVMPDLSDIRSSSITLPATVGTANIPVVWQSSAPTVIGLDGSVTRPDKFDATVVLSATIALENNGVTYTLKKEFIAVVKAFTEMSEIVANWDFNPENIIVEDGKVKVKDASDNQFVGTMMNDARLRTIGETEQFNVIDLGNGTGYFDLGEAIGEAIYALNDFSMSGYFRIDDAYAQLTNNGNFLWTFSNTADAPADQNGYLLTRLNNMSYEITPNWYATGNQGLYSGSAAPKGTWQHIAYTQKGTIGTLYLNGVQIATGTISNLPSISLPKAGRKGTLHNWIGRANYPSDVYLRQTLVHGFQIYSIALTGDNLLFDLEIPAMIDKLNAAFTENPDFISQAVVAEAENLTLPDMSALTSDITLPVNGSLDPTVDISWKSSHPQIISNAGVVTRPDYFNFGVTLTATVSKGAQAVTKSFPATVLVKPGTEFTGDLIAKFDFSNADGRFVADKGEKGFLGMTVNEARIRTIGTTESGQFSVLDLGNGTGYFDMGEEIGKTMYHLTDYTLSAFYRIEPEYLEQLNSNGNFIWTFSNTNDAMARPTGYIIGSLKNLAHSITPGFYTAESGNQALGFNEPALTGNWHHIAYTQNGTNATLYLDGMPIVPGDITNTPASALKKDGLLGTLYNWIGRSNYTGDVYLRQSLVYDFRVYKKALSDFDILVDKLNVIETLEKLELAYAANPDVSSVKAIKDSPYTLATVEGGIRINGLKGNEKVSVYDMSGRYTPIANGTDIIRLNKGVYVVKIDQYTAKVMVQ